MHYGVLGMKWGVRRTKEELDAAAGRNTRKSKRQINRELSKMSDTELRNKINRLNMEQQYKRLNQNEVSAGRKLATAILTESAKVVASNYVRQHLEQKLDPLLAVKKKGK